MQSTRFRAAALLAVFVSTGSPSCDDGDDEQPLQPSCVDCGGEGGSGEGGGLAGDATSSSGSSTLPSGGAAAGTSSAGATGDAGAGSPGGQGGAGSVGAAAGAGGAMPDTGGEQLELCARLAHGAQDADTVASAYVGAVYRDCRVSWVVPRGQALADLVNQLVSFSYNLWGCERTLPVDEFGLVLGTPPLSQGDASLLIEQYLVAAQKTLDLSLDERQTMQAALVRLSKPLVLDASVEPSKSACDMGMGGAGGAGGASAGGAGAGFAGGMP